MFSTELKNIKILTVLDLHWSTNIRNSEIRSFHALSFRLRGNATFICDNKQLSVNDNDIVFVPKGIRYTLDHGNEHLYVIHFDTDTPLPKEITVIDSHNKPLIKEMFTSLFNSWFSSKTSERYNAYAEFYRILSILSISEQPSKKESDDDKLTLITEHIHNHFRDPDLSVEKLSELFGTSESYFRRAFTERYSHSPLKYINSLKLKYAQELLLSGYYSIEQVSDMAGFHDAKYFSRFIKKETGFSPSDIKKNTL